MMLLRPICAFCQIDPIEYVEDICENMQLFPKQDILTGDQLMFEFNEDVSISEVSQFMVLFSNPLFISDGIEKWKNRDIFRSVYYLVFNTFVSYKYIS